MATCDEQYQEDQATLQREYDQRVRDAVKRTLECLVDYMTNQEEDTALDLALLRATTPIVDTLIRCFGPTCDHDVNVCICDLLGARQLASEAIAEDPNAPEIPCTCGVGCRRHPVPVPVGDTARATIEDLATGAALEIANRMAPGPWPGPGNLVKLNDPKWSKCYQVARAGYLATFATLADGRPLEDCFDAGFYAAIEVRDDMDRRIPAPVRAKKVGVNACRHLVS